MLMASCLIRSKVKFASYSYIYQIVVGMTRQLFRLVEQ
jgi:hypothetical protein